MSETIWWRNWAIECVSPHTYLTGRIGGMIGRTARGIGLGSKYGHFASYVGDGARQGLAREG